MSKEETAAIMGAHTLGNLDQANSGYSGNWLIDPEGVLTMRTTFDNSFYSFMMNSDYTYTGRVSSISNYTCILLVGLCKEH